MKTREESLNNFINLLDELIQSRYLFANTKIFDVVTAINSSKLLSDMFNYFIDGYDFKTALLNALNDDNGQKSFELPVKNTDVLAFVYLLIRELNFKNLQLTDLLDYFDSSKNYENAYQIFAKTVLVPFKSYTYQIGMQMINVTQTKEEVLVSKNHIEEEPLEHVQNDVQKPIVKHVETNATFENSLSTIIRLIDLDRLAVKESRLSSSDTQELEYVLKIFEEKIREKDKEKIHLIYLAYVYAVRPFKKLKCNVKRIAEILMDEKII